MVIMLAYARRLAFSSSHWIVVFGWPCISCNAPWHSITQIAQHH